MTTTRPNVARMANHELEAELDQWEDGDTSEYTDEESARWAAVDNEIDARLAWDADDDRVAESVGNYR